MARFCYCSNFALAWVQASSVRVLAEQSFSKAFMASTVVCACVAKLAFCVGWIGVIELLAAGNIAAAIACVELIASFGLNLSNALAACLCASSALGAWTKNIAAAQIPNMRVTALNKLGTKLIVKDVIRIRVTRNIQPIDRPMTWQNQNVNTPNAKIVKNFPRLPDI